MLALDLPTAVDSSVSGSRFRASASPSLAHLARDTAKEVPHPTSPNKTLWDARLDSGTLYGFVDPEVQEMYDLEHGTVLEENAATASAGFGVGPLGSGSDYTVFLQRIGVSFMISRLLQTSGLIDYVSQRLPVRTEVLAQLFRILFTIIILSSTRRHGRSDLGILDSIATSVITFCWSWSLDSNCTISS